MTNYVIQQVLRTEKTERGFIAEMASDRHIISVPEEILNGFDTIRFGDKQYLIVGIQEDPDDHYEDWGHDDCAVCNRARQRYDHERSEEQRKLLLGDGVELRLIKDGIFWPEK